MSYLESVPLDLHYCHSSLVRGTILTCILYCHFIVPITRPLNLLDIDHVSFLLIW